MEAGALGSRPVLLAALGGNALMERNDALTFEVMQRNAQRVALQIAAAVSKGCYRVVVTHGNGPQVGLLACHTENSQWPLSNLGAQTQGMIGSVLVSELRRLGLRVVCCLTHVLVSNTDAAMNAPSKPIGPFYKSKPTAFPAAFDEAKGEWRKVVASPEPIEVLELDAIKALLCKSDLDVIVCAGGGGIPCTRDGGAVDAVIDKDLTSSLLATQLGVDLFVIHTDVEGIFEDFPKREKLIREVCIADVDAKKFPSGTMRPKVEACIRFVAKAGGNEKHAVIGNDLEAILSGKSGTRFVKRKVEKSKL